MANILSLAVRVTGDASGLQLTPVEKALQRLQQESDKTSAIFEKFASSSELGAQAQQQFDAASAALLQTLRDGNITRDEFVKQFSELEAGARETAAALAEGARVTESTRTVEERYAAEIERLNRLREKGGIDQETYNRAVEAARRPLDAAAAAAARAGDAATRSTLQFNELSGVFAVLPGPLGNIAGRFSGLSSASQGLSRIFAGGLQSGLTGIIGSVTALVNPVTLALAGVTAFAAGASALASSLVALEDRVEKLGRLADQLGVSLGFAQVLEEAGKRTDVSVQQISSSFARLQNTLASGGEESKKASEALGRLGISLEDFGKLSQQQQIELIGEKLASIEDPAKRSAAAIALFGRSGVQLLPFFNGLDLASTDMERFGRAITDIDRRRLDDFGNGLDALSLATKGLGDSLTLPFVGLGEGIAKAGAEIISGFTAIIDPIGRILEPLFTQIGRIVERVGNNIGTLGRIIGAVFEPFAEIVQEVAQALEPLYEGLFDFLASINDAAVATTEWLISFTPVGAIAENAKVLGETISRIVTIITTAATKIGEVFGSIASRFSETVQQSEVLSTIANVVSAVFETISSFVGGIVEGIGKFVNNLLTLAETFLGIDRNAAAAAESTAELAGEVAELSKEEQKLLEEQEKFLAGYSAKVSDAINQSAQFGQAGFDAALQYQTAIAELQEQFDRGILNEESFRREAEKASAAYTAQIDTIKKAAAETQAITDRVDGLLNKANELPKIQQDILAVDAEIARVEAAAAEARANGQTEQADALAARLGQLDQLQASLNEQADQAAQGFDKGFEDAFAKVNSGLQSLVQGAAEFGDEGFAAAQRLADGIAAAQAQVEDGILNAEAFDAEVARQEELYNARIAQLEDERDRRIKAEKDIANERQRVNEFVNEQLALAEFGGDSARLAASRNVAAIEQEIARVQAEVDAARAAGDQDAVRAGTARIAQLDQIAAKEEDIASGRKAAEEEIAKAREAAIAQQKKNAEAFAKAQEQQASRAQAAQQKRSEEFQAALQAQAKENERVLANRRQLATASNQAAQGADIRTSEGANAFIQAVQGGFDPQLAVQRQQLKVQQRIAVGLEANLSALGFQTFRFPAAAGA